jgi:thiosulfate/3-mercaptopyruvate sulfurtransferase
MLSSCTNEDSNRRYLIDIHEFKKLSKKKNVKIIDFRKETEFSKGNVKNAINIWRRDIENPIVPYGGMKATKNQLETLFSNLGIENDDTLVIYDDKGLCDAVRMWWVLQYYNFKNVKLLDGGMATLKSENITLTKEAKSFPKSEFRFSNDENKTFYASKEQIEKAVENNIVLIDTRTADEFSGKYIKKGAYRAGRIPNSKLIDWANAINFNGDKKLKSIAELKEIYADISHNKNDTIFVYCHSGVRSAHTTFVLTQILGYKNVLNYDGSWTEWSYYKELPIINNSKMLN